MGVAIETRNPVTNELIRVSVDTSAVTIATTSTTDTLIECSESGVIDAIEFISVDALAAHASNYVTFSVTNLGQSGSGSAVLLAATDANTTKTTTGTAIAANSRRQLTLSATLTDLRVARGDVLRVRFTATGTLAGTVTGSRVKVSIDTSR